MKKTLLLMFALLMSISGAWAESQLSKAVVGTYLFDSSNPALTINKEGSATITNNGGTIVIHHSDLSIVTNVSGNNRTLAAVVMRVDMPTTAPDSWSQFINLKTSSNNTGSIGIGVTTEGKLKGTWGGSEWSGNGGGVVTTSAVTGEHTIVLLCNDDGTTIYLDNASTSVSNSGLKCATKWTDLRIESAYASCVKSVYVFSGDQASNISAFFSELSNVVTVANSETKSVSENSTATRFFVASGGTLTADAAFGMDAIEGAGDVTVDANQTISGNIATIATGKLTINEGKTLTLGAGDSQTNSIESFSSIDLCGTIYHNNKKATLNNVTVPSDKTGKIFAFDMGADTDAFKLAGTTTLTGNLTILSRWNAQVKVDELSGDGTLTICGTTGGEFDDTKTQSSENAIFNIANASSFTGSAILNNYYATVNLTGSCHVSSLSGLAILNVAEGATISAPSVPNAMELHGAGDVVLTTFPTSTAPNLSSWTGTIEFPDKYDATNITDILNAWGNENSTIKLNNLTGYFSNNTTPVNPTLNILENKTLNINNGFSNKPPILSKLTGKGDLNISWGNCTEAFNLTIQKLFDFDGTLKTAKAPIIVKKLEVASAPYADALLIKTSGTVTLEKLYVDLDETTAYTWETKTVNEVEGIYVSNLDQVQLCRETAAGVVAPYYNYIGTGVGQYTISLGVNNYTSIADFTEAINAWTTTADYVAPSVAINQPTSAFYRFNIGDNYMCNVASSDNVRTTTTTNNDASTIFYLNDANYLIAYADGYGFNYGYCKATAPGIFNSFDFSESSVLGKYQIHSNPGTESNDYSNRYITINGDKLAEGNGAWTIEEVTSLPVTITVAGVATLYSPVALTIPEGVKAYTGAIGEGYISMTEIETTIPKNTGVYLVGNQGTYNFEIAADVDAIPNNCFTGTIPTIANPNTGSIYALGRADGEYGFYKWSTGNLSGFKAYISTVSAGSNGFKIVFNDDDVTAVEAVIVNGQSSIVNGYYDLQGRKVVAPQKGQLYIHNGKKVLY